MPFTLVCTDIDGTLLNADRQLSPLTIQTIRSLPQHMPVVLASSRMPKAMRHLQAEMDILHHPLICYNGGYVIHQQQATGAPEVLHSVVIPATICRKIIELAAGTEVHVSLYHADEWYVPAQDQWAERERNNTKVEPEVADLFEIVERWNQLETGAHKVMCMGPAEGIQRIWDILESEVSSELNLYRSKPTYLEIAHGSINKATALQLLLEKSLHGHAMERVIAFGDNYNDIELLRAAGIGVAVGNAKEEVKAIAQDVTLPGKEDGVAMSILKWRSGNR
jgi:Cof subfamily protein (haloacid dehalogenase superfamily)